MVREFPDRRRFRLLFHVLPALVLLLLLILAPAPALQAREPWHPLPWHFVDIFYDYPRPVPFHSLRTGVTVNGNVDEHHNLYLAVVYGKIGKTAFYFGLQTNLGNAPSHRDGGRGVIFSRWGEPRSDDARTGDKGWSAALTAEQSGEGAFVGIRLPYHWGAGSYDFLLVRRPAEDGRGWWADLLMYDRQARLWVDVGGLRFPEPADAAIATSVASFVELYGRRPSPDFPYDYVQPPLIARFAVPELAASGAPVLKVSTRTGAGIPRWAVSRWSGVCVTVALDRPDPLGQPIPLKPEAVGTTLYRAVAPRRRPAGRAGRGPDSYRHCLDRRSVRSTWVRHSSVKRRGSRDDQGQR